jgi:hypothetical protein
VTETPSATTTPPWQPRRRFLLPRWTISPFDFYGYVMPAGVPEIFPESPDRTESPAHQTGISGCSGKNIRPRGFHRCAMH